MPPEQKLQNYLKDRVEALGGQFRKLEWTGRRGAPDCFIWWPGPSFAFVEVKAPDGRVTVLQQRELDRLSRDGFNTAVVWSKDDIDAVVFALTQPVGCVQ